jgi:hypothetical protein
MAQALGLVSGGNGTRIGPAGADLVGFFSGSPNHQLDPRSRSAISNCYLVENL